MTNQNLSKLLIKIKTLDVENKWVHLCYIPEELYNEYKEKRPEDLSDLNSTISRWVKEDFNKELPIVTTMELETLKSAVKEYCKEQYPDIYLEQTTDRQGWLRVWITRKMREDLKKDGK